VISKNTKYRLKEGEKMSANISDDIKNAIIEIYEKENNLSRLFMFENIPPKRLENAIKSYALAIGNDETIIFLFDDTFFGSGKDGFILTAKCLYYRNYMEKASSVGVADIIDMDIKSVKLNQKVIVKTSARELEVSITSAPDKKALFNVLDQTVKFLKNPTYSTDCNSPL